MSALLTDHSKSCSHSHPAGASLGDGSGDECRADPVAAGCLGDHRVDDEGVDSAIPLRGQQVERVQFDLNHTHPAEAVRLRVISVIPSIT